MPQPVIDAVVNHIRLESEIGGYEAAHVSAAAINACYDSTASLINAQRHEIALVENATRGWDMAFYAIPFVPGDQIVTSMAEYGSNAIAFLQMQQRGVEIVVVPNDETGQLDVRALADLMN